MDFSPSASCSDINMKGGTVLLDQQVAALRRSIEGIIRPFYVPGSQVGRIMKIIEMTINYLTSVIWCFWVVVTLFKFYLEHNLVEFLSQIK